MSEQETTQIENEIEFDPMAFMALDKDCMFNGIFNTITGSEAVDIEKIIASMPNNVTKDEISVGIPSVVGNMLSAEAADMVLSDTIGEFIVNSVHMMFTISAALAFFRKDLVSTDMLGSIINNIIAFKTSAPGSTAEVFSSKKLAEAIDSLNENALRSNSQLVAAFEDENIGFATSAVEPLMDSMGYELQDNDEEVEEAKKDLIARLN